jgi:hypothetical protein
MLGLTGLGQSAIAAFGPNGTPPAISEFNGTFLITPAVLGNHAADYERAARGYRFFQAGVQGPNVAPNPQVRNVFIGRQEQPYHPGPFFQTGVQGPNVAPPPLVRSTIIVTQEQPNHPGPKLWPGFQLGNVGPWSTGVTYLFGRQEQPWHPRSYFWVAPPPVPKQLPFEQSLMLRQEQPWHPGSFFNSGTIPFDYEDVQVLIFF